MITTLLMYDYHLNGFMPEFFVNQIIKKSNTLKNIYWLSRLKKFMKNIHCIFLQNVISGELTLSQPFPHSLIKPIENEISGETMFC